PGNAPKASGVHGLRCRLPRLQSHAEQVSLTLPDDAPFHIAEAPRCTQPVSAVRRLAATAPQLSRLGGHTDEIGRDDLRLGDPVYRQRGIDAAGDQGGARVAGALGAERVPNVCRDHAAFGELRVELLSNHVIALRGWLESPNPVNAELSLEKLAEA